MLRKYLPDESHVLQPQAVKVNSKMSYVKEHIADVCQMQQLNYSYFSKDNL